nr:MAG TPA: hypothetical protein [Caudoviricetes sp.]
MLFLLKKCTFHFEKMYISFCRLYNVHLLMKK